MPKKYPRPAEASPDDAFISALDHQLDNRAKNAFLFLRSCEWCVTAYDLECFGSFCQSTRFLENLRSIYKLNPRPTKRKAIATIKKAAKQRLSGKLGTTTIKKEVPYSPKDVERAKELLSHSNPRKKNKQDPDQDQDQDEDEDEDEDVSQQEDEDVSQQEGEDEDVSQQEGEDEDSSQQDDEDLSQDGLSDVNSLPELPHDFAHDDSPDFSPGRRQIPSPEIGRNQHLNHSHSDLDLSLQLPDDLDQSLALDAAPDSFILSPEHLRQLPSHVVTTRPSRPRHSASEPPPDIALPPSQPSLPIPTAETERQAISRLSALNIAPKSPPVSAADLLKTPGPTPRPLRHSSAPPMPPGKFSLDKLEKKRRAPSQARDDPAATDSNSAKRLKPLEPALSRQVPALAKADAVQKSRTYATLHADAPLEASDATLILSALAPPWFCLDQADESLPPAVPETLYTSDVWPAMFVADHLARSAVLYLAETDDVGLGDFFTDSDLQDYAHDLKVSPNTICEVTVEGFGLICRSKVPSTAMAMSRLLLPS